MATVVWTHRTMCDVQYRGPCPLEHTLMNGDTHTGVAVIRIDPTRFDVGAVVSMTPADVAPSDTLARHVCLPIESCVCA